MNINDLFLWEGFFLLSTCKGWKGEGMEVLFLGPKAPFSILGLGAREIPRSTMKVLLWDAMSLELLLPKVLSTGHQTLI